MAKIDIFFGSQSGTAECFAEELCEECVANGFQSEVIDLAKFEPEDFASRKLVIVVISTYGEGEPPDNAHSFHRWVSDPRHGGALKGQRFCVMGLGDMNYSLFNNMGLVTDASLERLGGKRIYQRGVGDDCQDIYEHFTAWRKGGLWEALKKAVAEVNLDLVDDVSKGILVPQVQQKVLTVKKEYFIFYAHEEDDGAAKEICEAVEAKMNESETKVSLVQSLSERKAVQILQKLPKFAVLIFLVDAGTEGICAAGRKLARNLNIELDSRSLVDKGQVYVHLTIATSKCNTSANQCKSEIQQKADQITKAMDRVGILPAKVDVPTYVDAGVEDVGQIIEALCKGVGTLVEPASLALPAVTATATQAESNGSSPVKILCAGDEAREAGEALSEVWPGSSVDIASLQSLAACSKSREAVVLAVQCSADGGLDDAARGLASQLRATPIALKAQLRQLKFAMLAVASTDYGNAGERASANAARDELVRAADVVKQSLSQTGASCLTSTCLDLQDADAASLTALSKSVMDSFKTKETAPQTTDAVTLAQKPAAGKSAQQTGSKKGTAVLRTAANVGALPAEVPGEPSDVLARYYFEATQVKVAKVGQLRQDPRPSEGLSTVEVVIEKGSLSTYTLGGTLSVLPSSDPRDVAAMLPLLGLTTADLRKAITFGAVEGMDASIKKPFPTPCTLGDALEKYCDLARAPSKKMLSALMPKIQDTEAQERVGRLIADAEALKQLHAPQICVRMHEFWKLLGVTRLDLSEFLISCPRQKPREFTIASSPKASPDKISLCVSLSWHQLESLESVFEALKDKGIAHGENPSSERSFFGMCSRWITTSLKAGDTLLVKHRPSPLHLPEKDIPVIMVGAGAGVAPFRGFWEELRRGSQAAPAVLFFGCRHQDQDWLYKAEMTSVVKLAASGCSALSKMQVGPKRPLTALYTAFSRPSTGQKKYVQNEITSQARSVKHWMEKMSGTMYICGSSAMGQGVFEALAEILEGGRPTVDALRTEGRIVAELW
eukprot:CAMPEP_0194503408 /NCGR_PEP_ID=MMETSP0253-20130528/28362_1 /TAXON_ID=2966 /ORGANISM="Noctiluca scintillans" /LENGTH=1009 /DNA_ID=CAMNT_0039345689 /DNA_START=42 /DNA_END=3068 /DNA_ORIENTATION=+